MEDNEIVWFKEKMLAQSRYPYSEKDLDDLYQKGIRAIISLQQMRDKNIRYIEEKGFVHLKPEQN